MKKPIIFWTTRLDSASEFGAGDPLALDYIAQQVGNWLLPGLTGRTTRASYYPMVLYGLILAEEAIQKYNLPKRDKIVHELFERWERFWALAIARHFRGKRIPENDRFGMRGVMGAERTASSNLGDSILLDYKLIQRQIELAALGAYLSSLRFYELVQEGTLTPTKLGRDVAGLFWNDAGHRLENILREYALEAMNPSKKTLSAKYRIFSIERLGELCRLGRIRERPKLQEKLWDILFSEPSRRIAHDYTPEMVKLLIKANQRNIISPRTICIEASEGEWPEILQNELRQLLKFVVLFEDLAAWSRVTFDNIYRYVANSGYTVPHQRLIKDTLPEKVYFRGAKLAKSFLNHPQTKKIIGLPYHGRGFVRFANTLSSGEASSVLTEMLAFHREVQVERKRSSEWLRERDGRVMASFMGYSALRADHEGWTHDFKFSALRSLLVDMGKIHESGVQTTS